MTRYVTDMIVAPTTRRHVMFEQLFTKPGTIGRYQAAPLVEPRERYLRHLAECGASRLTLRQIALDQVRLLHVLDLSEGEKVTVSRIEAIAPKWDRTRHHKLGHRRATSQKSTKRALSRATRWLRFLGWLDELEEERHPYGVEAGAFEEWSARAWMFRGSDQRQTWQCQRVLRLDVPRKRSAANLAVSTSSSTGSPPVASRLLLSE